MKKNKLSFLSAFIYAAIFFATPIQAKVWRVNNNGYSADATDLQVAVTAAQPHDTLHVEASGTDYVAITLGKPLVIIGPGYFLNMNPGLQKNPTTATIISITFSSGSAGSVISGISIDHNGNGSSIYINESNVTVERCYILGGFGFQNVAPTTLSNIILKQCYVSGGISNTGNNSGGVNNLMISNCYFGGIAHLSSAGGGNNYTGMVTQCVFEHDIASSSSSVTYRNNIMKTGSMIQNNNSIGNVEYNLFITATMPAWLSGGTNVSQLNNVFIPTTGSSDHNLMQNDSISCPSCYHGYPSSTGIIGMFGGIDSYPLSGIPEIPAIYLLQAPTPVMQGGNINVNISTRTNN